MARKLNVLSARFCQTVEQPGRYADGGGLYLVVGGGPVAKGKAPRAGAPGSSKAWVFRYRDGSGRQRDMGLGPFASVPLADAREAAEACRRQLAKGVDPQAARRTERAKASVPTFRQAAEQLRDSRAATWRNEKHRQEWLSSLENHCGAIMDMAVDRIDVASVLAVLSPIWTKRAETASRIRGRIEAVLDAGKVRGVIAEGVANPARWKGHLAHILGKRSKLTRGHHRALAWADLPGFMASLRDRNSVDAKALEFTILTASRSGEVFGARWAELDLGQRLWVVPGKRMKAGRPHRVPLSPRALMILAEMAALRKQGDTDGFVFPGRKPGMGLSSMAFAMLLRRMKVEATAHGFRSSFRDWCGDATSFPREVAEGALAHTIGGVEAAYRRGDALEKRRQLLEAWSDYCAGGAGANVLPLVRKAV